MDYKYEEALKRAKKIYQGKYKPEVAAIISETLPLIFPELKESEDERIRKEIIQLTYKVYAYTDFLTCDKQQELLAWLEKKKEQKPIECGKDEKIRKEIKQHFLFLDESDPHKEKWIAWLEKQSGKPQGKSALEAIQEEKADNADKVEPKFKAGDFVINTHGFIMQIVGISPSRYYYEVINDDRYDVIFDCPYSEMEKSCHLWTIEDAKDGDVLVYNNGSTEIILLYKKLRKSEESVFTHAHCFDNQIRLNDWCDFGKTAHPATQEQRDLLFQKMAEAGYEWDAEKKVLRTIQKPNLDNTDGTNTIKFKE